MYVCSDKFSNAFFFKCSHQHDLQFYLFAVLYHCYGLSLLTISDAIFELVGGKNNIQLVRVLQTEVKPGKCETRILV
jgi:hypothetical protein